MTEIYRRRRRMLRDESAYDSPRKCRQRRRHRRLLMRRPSTSSPARRSPPTPPPSPPTPPLQLPIPILQNRYGSSSSLMRQVSVGSATGESSRRPASLSAVTPGLFPSVFSPDGIMVAEPEVGSMSVAGRSRGMEDAVTVRTGLCMPEINQRRPVHFFGVYDGHGGDHVSALCKEMMHVFFAEEVMTRRAVVGSRSAVVGHEELLVWRNVMRRSFERMDEVALNSCPCGSVGFRCRCQPQLVELGGSTAVVTVLTQDIIIVANCGDSRAVLCRGNTAFPLSIDHKPDRPDELARIHAAGGRVIFLDGARVSGILAMSRAIGDKFLKPVVTSEPEVTFTRRHPDDECLIIGSDGLWDALSSQMACEVARACLRGGGNVDEQTRALYPTQSMLAAALLTRLALGRRSSDNISCVIVDLKKSRDG